MRTDLKAFIINGTGNMCNSTICKVCNFPMGKETLRASWRPFQDDIQGLEAVFENVCDHRVLQCVSLHCIIPYADWLNWIHTRTIIRLSNSFIIWKIKLLFHYFMSKGNKISKLWANIWHNNIFTHLASKLK